MSEAVRIVYAADADVRQRGGGVRTTHMITPEAVEGTTFVNGITEFEAGAELGFHFHNCVESVLVLEGNARFDLKDSSHDMGADDVTFVPANVTHRFVNTGDTRMRLFFVYGSATPTRTMIETGETFPIGSPLDVLKPGPEH